MYALRFGTSSFISHRLLDERKWENRVTRSSNLITAARRGKTGYVQWLLNHGASVNSAGRYGRTALTKAAAGGAPTSKLPMYTENRHFASPRIMDTATSPRLFKTLELFELSLMRSTNLTILIIPIPIVFFFVSLNLFI